MRRRALVLAAMAATGGAGAQSAPLARDLITGEAIDPRLDPEARAVLEAAVRSGGLPAEMAAKRRAFDTVFAELGGAPAPMETQDLDVPGGGVRVRAYRPGPGRLPAVIYTHGGGFEKGSLASHDAPLRALAAAANSVVIAVDYPLAPEAAFPAQTDAAFGVLRWAASEAGTARLGHDPTRLAVAGDSVGGNLAAVSAIRARDSGGLALRAQLLFYPVTDMTLSSESWRRFAEGPWLTRAYEANALQRQYLAGRDPRDPLASPLFVADARGLAPALVYNAEFDGYRDEGQAYAAKLREAGVAVQATIVPGQLHDVALMGGRIAAARRLLADAGGALRAALG